MSKSLSLIITTYNNAAFLRLVLESVLDQSTLPDEVIIADDGSGECVHSVIEMYRRKFPVRLIHSWLPDRRFRLSRSRNIAALKAKSDFLLFIDGDCVLPPHFIRNHRAMIERGKLLCGARKLLSSEETARLLESNVSGDTLGKMFSGRKFWRLPFGVFRSYPCRSWSLFRGFLMGVESKLLREVAGFDESFQSWGLEDSDFAVRAQRLGGRIKDGRYATAVLHLYHSEPMKGQASVNSSAFADTLNDVARVFPKQSVFLN